MLNFRTSASCSFGPVPPIRPFQGERWQHSLSGIEYHWSHLSRVWVEGGGIDAPFPKSPQVLQRFDHGDKQWVWNAIGWALLRPFVVNSEDEIVATQRLVLPAITVDSINLDGDDLAGLLSGTSGSLQDQINAEVSNRTQADSDLEDQLTNEIHSVVSALGSASLYDVGTGALDVLQLDNYGNFPELASSQLYALPGLYCAYSAYFTRATITGNISSVDTDLDEITWSTDHGLTTGMCIIPIGGTWPGGTTTNRHFYVRETASNKFKMYLTAYDADNDSNAINLTSAGSSTRTMARYVPSNEAKVYADRMHTTQPMGFGANEQFISFDINFSSAPESLGVILNGSNVMSSNGDLVPAYVYSISLSGTRSNVPIISADIYYGTVTGSGTWQQQATNVFYISTLVFAGVN